MALFVLNLDGYAFPESFAGAKLVAFGRITHEEVEAIGATPVPMPTGEWYAAAQVGVIDGVAVKGVTDRDAALAYFSGDGAFVKVTDSDGPDTDAPTSGSDDLIGTGKSDVVQPNHEFPSAVCSILR